MSEWTPRERKIETAHGTIHYGGPCKDDYGNMVIYDPAGSAIILTLQRPAMRAFWEAEVIYAKRMGWSDERIANNGGHGRPISVTPGTNRTCATQAKLYASDPNRYAEPKITGHTRGLAIDVSQAQANLDKINRALRLAGWTQARPDDEPWHWSYGVTI